MSALSHIIMNLGSKIKQLRSMLQLTQEDLANRCELTKGYISQLENNHTSPSITTLSEILEVLGTNLADFFYEDKMEKIVFTRLDQSDKKFEEYEITWLIPTSQQHNMEPILITINKEGQTIEDSPHEGQEFGYVLKGTIQVVYGNQSETCNAGESFYIITNKSHYLKNIGDSEAKLLWISYPPNF